MNLKSQLIILLMTFFTMIGSQAFAVVDSKSGVAKVIVMRGTVDALVGGKKSSLSKGSWLPEGAAVVTADRSFAKLLFVDKSSMNVGPKSKIEIKSFPKEKAGIISLVKGSIRSKVTKDYMNIKDKNKSKLFIKTRSAALGVRGTDFQCNFNEENANTSLVTYSGAVAMANLEEGGGGGDFDQQTLESAVSSDQAVIVRKGQFSAASPNSGQASTPVKISPAQLESMKSNDVPGLKAEGGTPQSNNGAPKKGTRSVLPPGVNAKEFANDSKELDKQMETMGGTEVLAKVDVALEKEAAAEGDYGGGEAGPADAAPGGFVDINTGFYIPPPEGSAFDPITGVFIPPPDFGGFNPQTGEYQNDSFQITNDGKMIAIVDPNGPGPGPDGPKELVLADIAPPSDSLDGPGDLDLPPPPDLDAIAEETVEETQENLFDQQIIESTTTIVDFAITVQ